jgi:hypothetical protein
MPAALYPQDSIKIIKASKTIIFKLKQIRSMEVLLFMPNAMKLGKYHLQKQIIIECGENTPQTTDAVLCEWQEHLCICTSVYDGYTEHIS